MKQSPLFTWLLCGYLMVYAPCAQAQNLVTYAGNARAEMFTGVMRLHDGTFLLAGSATNLDWITGTPRIVQLSPQNIENPPTAGVEARTGFILHLSADLQQIQHVLFFPSGAVQDIRHIKTDTPPGVPTGNLYISGTTSSGYFLARLNNNFVNGPATGLEWAWNVEATGNHQSRQPWDVGGDGKVVFASGTPDGFDWAAVYRLRADGQGLDIVPHWRYHFGVSTLTGQRAEGMWTPAWANPDVAPQGSGVVFKADLRCSLRSWSEED